MQMCGSDQCSHKVLCACFSARLAVVIWFVSTHDSVVECLMVLVFWSAPMVCHFTADYWSDMPTTAFSVVCVNVRTQRKDISAFSSFLLYALVSECGLKGCKHNPVRYGPWASLQ